MTAPVQPISPVLVTARYTAPRTANDLLRQITDPFGVYCVLEVQGNWAEGASIFHAFPVMPESLEVAQRYLQTITPTQGGVFIDEYGRAPSPIVLRGTFGRSPRLGVALGQEALLKNLDRFSGAQGSISETGNYEMDIPVTGYKLMKLLSEMVDLSHRVDRRTGQLPTARFYNFAFGAFYEVALNSFRASMSVDRNGLWFYELQMTMLRRINDGMTDSTTQFKLATNPEEAFRRAQALYRQRYRETDLGNGFNVGRAITRWVPDRVRGILNLPSRDGISPAESLLSENNKTRQLLQDTFDFVERTRRTTNTVNSWISSTRGLDIIAYGAGVLDRTLELSPGTVGGFVNTVRRWPEIVNAVQSVVSQSTRRIPKELRLEIEQAVSFAGTITASADRYLAESNEAPLRLPFLQSAITDSEELNAVVELTEAAANLQDAVDSVLVLLYVHGLIDTPADATSAVFSVIPDNDGSPAVRPYVIIQGDTLARIAYLHYGDENLWPQVLSAMGPQFDGIAPTEVLDPFIGTVVSLRNPETDPVTLIPDVWDVPAGSAAFGKDLADTLDTYLRADGTRDLVVLDNYNTLMQGLLHRLQTLRGAIPDRPDFGSLMPSVLGQEFGALRSPMDGAKAEETLRLEPRLETVLNVEARQELDTLSIQFNAVARNAGSLGNVNLSISRQSP